ncbi:hypothetical protein HanPSC8_Chr02g0072901 [Helianthus annuus]|nr:hypothetical protein HanPSC8_Chr02g0072901 [Helianthus annuus]
MSAWGRGGEDVFSEKLFKKTNKLQDPKVCARLRDADISAQKSFCPKNKHHRSVNYYNVQDELFIGGVNCW